MNATDERWMRAALALARRGLGTTGSNPSVGCLIVKDGHILGRGRTARGGRPHAETAALADTAERYGVNAARGATVYVTLEPCAHHGKTPPCADALAAASIARVVAPIADPDTRVAGRGFARLQEAGCAVTVGPCAEEAKVLLAGYLRQRRGDRPLLTLKLATTLDGKIATGGGESRWITGPMARRRVHLMRARHDAVLVGSGTVLADDPSLDVRIAGMEDCAPVPLVADRTLQTPPTARLLANGAAIVFGDSTAYGDKAKALSAAGASVAPLAQTATATDLLDAIGAMGIGSILCEGGSMLAASLLQSDCVDRLVWFTAGCALGADSRPAVDALTISALNDAQRWALETVEPVGTDTMSVWAKHATKD